MGSIRKISLLLRLVAAGTSVRSGVSTLATERLLEGRAAEKRIRPLNIPDPVVQHPGRYSHHKRSTATLLLLRA